LRETQSLALPTLQQPYYLALQAGFAHGDQRVQERRGEIPYDMIYQYF